MRGWEAVLARWRVRQGLIITGACLVLPNVAAYLVGIWVPVQHPAVAVDYLLPGVLLPWIGALPAALSVAVLSLLDMLFSVAPVYHFVPLSVLTSLVHAVDLAPSYVVPVAAGVLGGVSLLGAVVWRALRGVGTDSKRLVVIPVCVLFVLIGLEVGFMVAGSPVTSGRDETADLIGSPAARFVLSLRAALARTEGPQSRPPSSYEVPSATASLFRALEGGEELPDRIVLVISESMGALRDSALTGLQMSALSDHRSSLEARYRVTSGRVETRGSTVPAELRELCRVRALTTHPDPAVLPVDTCLPQRLKRRGYRTVAVHGFSGNFFARNLWWSSIGFGQLRFQADLSRDLGTSRTCGPVFKGLCDRDVWRWIERHRRQRAEPSFYYWMTLNAHPPLEAPPPGTTTVTCDGSAFRDLSPALCHLVAQNDAVLRGVVESALDPDWRNTLFVVVGDHPPAILDERVRGQYLERLVPFVVLWPREGS